MENGSEHSQGRPQNRKLAAIMFTDMVGYSALSQLNESLALQLLDEHRRIVRQILLQHGGREIDTAGDAFFVEFASAVEAGECAIKIQTTFHERNKSLHSENHITLRIGLHLGDVVYFNDKVHGDGVNIAARLEPLASAGGICLSEDFAHAVLNKLKYPVVRKGTVSLKNISEPMDIFCVRFPWLEEESVVSIRKEKSRFPLKLILSAVAVAAVLLFLVFDKIEQSSAIKDIRVAVLPFLNIGSDPDNEYFADGMTEQLISSLSNLTGLSVIASSSVIQYKGAVKNISDIGSELNVSSVLEGSIRKQGDKIRITVKLIDVKSQRNLWAMDYDRELKDIFKIQSEIAQNITDELKVKLRTDERAQLQKNVTISSEAYNAYLLGRFYLNRRNIDGVTRSIGYFQKAIGIEPAFALAYSGLADAYTLIGSAGYGTISPDEAVKSAVQNVQKALELNDNLAEAHASLAYIYFRLEWKFDEAEKEFKRAITLGPSYAQAHEWYALYLSLRGRHDEALSRMKRAAELNPLSTSVSNGIGRIYYFKGEMDEAVRQLNKTIKMDPHFAEAHFSLGMVYTAMNQLEKAIPVLEHAVQLSNRRLIVLADLAYAYGLAGRRDKVEEIISEFKERSETENVSEFLYVPVYAGLGDKEKVFELLEKAYSEKYGLMLYMKADHLLYRDIIDDPRYYELIRRIGL